MNTKKDSEYKDIEVELVEDIKNSVKSMRVKQGWTFKVTDSIFHSNKRLRIKSKNKDHSRIDVLRVTEIMNEIIVFLIYYYIIYILVLCEYPRESDLLSMNLKQSGLTSLINYAPIVVSVMVNSWRNT